jgi:hypothetical protein
MGRAQQLDATCLNWLIKKPGRTAIEKAGSAQEILAVVREESYDNLENQVLKDFLQRAARACGDYVRENSVFLDSARYKCVEQFSKALARYSKADYFAGVRSITQITKPNYVLQHDKHYSTIWKAYQELVRRQASLEHLFEWRFRAYRDLVRLLFCSAVWSLSTEVGKGSGSNNGEGLWIRRKPVAGSVFESNGWPNLVQFDYLNGCYITIIAPETLCRDRFMGTPIRRLIAAIGPDLAVIVSQPGIREFSLWVIWTSFGSLVEHPRESDSKGLEGAEDLLRKIAAEHPTIRGLHGILVTGTPLRHGHFVKDNAHFLRVSHDHNSWRKTEMPEMKKLFRKLIQKDQW